ncbi:hypothetical protein [Stenotrophomonas maltophilia]|uniref:hypothetical protein n=1 Tax=Stenotrophomonas maltophilia TaxID=40324 RepID=UPI0015DE89E3|nr:hypothetical protein [Stenotrophomonas maltophilia]
MSAQDKYSLQERGRFKAWWDAARPLEGSAFPYEIAWAAWQAALSAQPSPGGQGDALAMIGANLRSILSLAAKMGGGAHPMTVANIHHEADHALQLLAAALDARQPVTMDDALAAGDGTLHGAIDHWQERALRAEAELAARQPVGEITDTEIDARLNALYREMVDSGQHNGGMSGVAWDRAVYRMASGSPAQAVDLTVAQAVAVYDAVTRRNFTRDVKSEEDKARTVTAALTDSQAVGNG